MFPGPISALDAAGISGKPEDEPPVLLSHQEGARFFSVRALKAGAVAAGNVIYRDRVYAFAFVAGGESDRSITFYEATGTAPDKAMGPRTPERFLGLLDQVREFEAIAAQYPALAQGIEQSSPGTEAVAGPITVIIDQVFRFPEEDALVFRVRIENRGNRDLRYPPNHLGVRVGEITFPAALTDASGLLPAGRSIRISLLIVGNPDGSPAHLSLKNSFALAMPPITSP